jgi:hypothetical protein
MLFISRVFNCILLHLIIAFPQINFDLTKWVSDDENTLLLQHDCLHVAAWIEKETDPYQIISYCMSEYPSKWKIQGNAFHQNFTFAELYHRNITSQQLYLWSAPLDVVEDYQSYLNELSTSNTVPSSSSSMATKVFYNCTSPRFGRLCQYSLADYTSDHLTLNEIIRDFYLQEYEPNMLTCYTHLECNLFSSFACLDWSDICDGIIDCEGGVDEESCWQLEINECGDNEYRCRNGQCISKRFLYDDRNHFECLDRSDEKVNKQFDTNEFIGEPTFEKEDITCTWNVPSEVKFTSSCMPKRGNLLKQLIFMDQPNSLSDDCWEALLCHLKIPNALNPECLFFCMDITCTDIINENCPDMMNVPARPMIFGHMYFAYNKDAIITQQSVGMPPHYICYNDQLCSGFYSNKTLLSFNNATCLQPADFPLNYPSMAFGRDQWLSLFVVPLSKQFHRCNTILYNDSTICNSPNMYRCLNSSKCISKHRLCDNMTDCDYGDDEQCSSITNSSECTGNFSDIDYFRKYISFSTICDGFTELIPVLIDGRNETDETECEQWPCNNIYTRCDGFWNCFNGEDELDCDSSPLFICPRDHHICVSPNTTKFMCLPLKQAHDGHIDCLGATDEPTVCRADDHQLTGNNFHCITDKDEFCIFAAGLCYPYYCRDRMDRQICNTTYNDNQILGICYEEYDTHRTAVENFFCKLPFDTGKPKIVNFSLGKVNNSIKQPAKQDIKAMIRHPSVTRTTIEYQPRCHRGLILKVWLNNEKNLTTDTCLCPPSFYGNMCQYQNQRVSLTLQFQTYSDSRRTLFAVIVSLIDDTKERLIHSYQQFNYLYVRDCAIKFNMYLLYSTRPKNLNTSYSVHIDIYEKLSFKYRTSFLIPLKFPFLPVHRVAVQLNIPRSSDGVESCSNQPCVHGQCIKYPDHSNDISFCNCSRGWSGRYCTIPHNYTCSSDSLYIGVLANNQSLCICPDNHWGSRCLLRSILCDYNQNTTCHNGGICIPTDEHVISNKKFTCICPKGFTGDRCEIADNKIIISFHKDIILPQTILIHFVRGIDNGPPENGTTFERIPMYQNRVTISWSRPFHIVFVKLFYNDYYLIVVQKTYNPSMTIVTTLKPSDRCPHINEILNETIVKYHLLRRIKYYHVPCRQHVPQLSCFYDDNHFCLCNDYGQQRVANCFEFNYTKRFDCFSQSNCEHGAECLQDKQTCPQTSMCLCQPCFHGARCQFSSRGFGLSLDAILGYHIQPHINMRHQPHAVQLSIALTIIMTAAGLISGILSIMTFNNPETRKVGCGIYLISSSITALLTMTIFALKFWILIIAQMTYLTNRLFLKSQCISIDFLLQICLNLNQWLNACVAVERAVTTMKGTKFSKEKSKQMAKYILLGLLILNISTTIHDPIHRRLIEDDDDDNEKRIWCFVTYPSELQTFNTVMNIFHFLTPFIINLISAPIIIIVTARQKTTVQKNQTYRKILKEQIQHHRHLLITPSVLVILAVPRLILYFVSSCMKSINDPWLFLTGYFISFIPSMLTFVVFVVPSKTYKQQFWKTYERYKKAIQRRLHLIS